MIANILYKGEFIFTILTREYHPYKRTWNCYTSKENQMNLISTSDKSLSDARKKAKKFIDNILVQL